MTKVIMNDVIGNVDENYVIEWEEASVYSNNSVSFCRRGKKYFMTSKHGEAKDEGGKKWIYKRISKKLFKALKKEQKRTKTH